MAIVKQDLDALLVQAKVNLVGAADAALRGELYDVMSEFLNDSSAWTQDVTIATQADVQIYDVSVPEGQIIRLVGIMNWGTTVPTPTTTPPTSSCFVPALMSDVGRITLASPPQDVSYLLATFVTNVALPVDRSGIPQAPDWLLPVWHVGLLDGLLGKMMTQPNKSYSNDKAAVYHLKRFRDAIARARVSKLRANTVGAQAWSFPQQFRTNGQRGGVPSSGAGSDRRF